jgi:HSP20 family protein
MWDMMGDSDDMFRLPALSQGMKAFVPAMDMYETDKAVVVELPLAGMKPEEVDVSVEKGVLTVKGESKKEHEVDEKNYYRKEIRSGAFYREVALPAPVLEDKVSAEFQDGVLKITAPKAQPAATKKIEVKVVKKEKKK